MKDTQLKNLLKNYGASLDNGYAAAFIGAGFSRPSGYVDWKELLRETAQDLGLDIDQENDLIAVAQFHCNEHGGRGQLNQKVISEFTKDTQLSENHLLLARLPLSTVWTTNYDTLVEDAFKAASKRVDLKITTENLAHTRPQSDVTVFKMHGDISLPDQAVITKEDYETYDDKRSLFSDQLKGDLISKSFLFLGFSFTDPNIDHVLGRIPSLLGKNCREHYWVTKRPTPPKPMRGAAKAKYEYDCHWFELRIKDLKRYGIQAVVLNDYAELTEILQSLNKLSQRRNILVSGSASAYGSVFDQDRLEGLACRLGAEIIRRGLNLVTGFGLGIGSAVMSGAAQALYLETQQSFGERVIPRPFPQQAPAGVSLKDLWTPYRREMISNTGFAVFLAGNKKDPATGTPTIATGVLKEFEIAVEMEKYPIPIGVTGYAAEQIWQEVNSNLSTYYPKHNVARHVKKLGDPKASDDEIVDAVFAIIKTVSG